MPAPGLRRRKQLDDGQTEIVLWDETTKNPSDPTSSSGHSRSPGSGPQIPVQSLEKPGDEIGPFKLLSMIGEGGFGTVWLAERRQPFVQRVALKVIKAGMDSKAVLARFEQERQALAVMNHPGIAKVLDGGLTPSGRPFFAMEHVKGEPITQFCDSRKLSIDERLKLFEQACEAIQHAHLKGIVHRDIKPSNMLAFSVEGEGPRLKVIDFGVAKAMSHAMTAHTVYTEAGQMIGTPEYMSPEQADPSTSDIDTRSDIYSLGVLLYELLTGALPFDPVELRKKAYSEIQRTIREDEPPVPSARLSTIATKNRDLGSRIEAARKVSIEELTRQLRGELEWIPLKAMRKEPQHRYQTAIAFAEDIRAYLSGEPISAAPMSTGYRLRKYVRRHRPLVIGASAVVATLVFGLALASWQWFAADRARAEAVAAKEAALASEAIATAERISADTARQEAVASGARTATQLERSNDLLGVIVSSQALNAVRSGEIIGARRDLAVLNELGLGESFAVLLAAAWSDQSIREPLRGHKGSVASVAFSPDGKTLASGSLDKTIRLWDSATGKPLGEPLRGHEGAVDSVAFSQDGKTVASGSRDKTIRLWDAATGKPLGEPLRGHAEQVFSVAFSPDGKTLASGSTDKTIRLWDAATGKPLGEPLRGHEDFVATLAFSPDGKTLASGSADKSIRLWDAATGKPLGEPLRGHEGAVDSVASSPDGKTVASGSRDKSIRLWDAATGKPLGEPLRGHEEQVFSVAFSPDGKTLASGSADKSIRLWDAATGKPLGEPLRGHEEQVFSVAFSPDGKTLASGSADKSIRLWDAATGKPLGEPLRGHEEQVLSVAFSPDGKTVASGSWDKTIRVWDAAIGKPLSEPLRGHEEQVFSVAFSPDGKTMASGSFDRTLRLWDAAPGEPIGEPLRGHEEQVFSVAFSPDGKTLASGSMDKSIRLWDAATGKPLGDPLRGHEGSIASVDFSPDGKTLVSGSWDKTIRLWSGVPMPARWVPYHARMAEVEQVRAQLTERIVAVGATHDAVAAFQTEVLGDPRFNREMRVPALIVVGEVSFERRAVRAKANAEQAERIRPLREAMKAKDWHLTFQLVGAAQEHDLADLSATDWNAIAWGGLTELAPESPVRRLDLLLTYAQRAVELSGRKDGDFLDTLARAHWELGDKAKAIEVQREVVALYEAGKPVEGILAEMNATLARYESSEPPPPSAAATTTPRTP